MTRFNEEDDDDVKERYCEINDQYRLTYPMDPWKSTEEEYIESTAKNGVIMLKKIDKYLTDSTKDILYYVKGELNHALLMV